LGSEEINKLSNYAVTTKDVAELIELITRLMEEYNKRIGQVNKYYAILLATNTIYPIHGLNSFVNGDKLTSFLQKSANFV